MSESAGSSFYQLPHERKEAFRERLGRELEPDVGPVDDCECDGTHCDEEAVYRVPFPEIGGDSALCGYHLACYRHDHPEIWARVQAGPFVDPDDYVAIGTRFVSIDEIPDKIRDGTYRLVCLDSKGYALYEGEPVDGETTFIRVDRRLNEIESKTVSSESVGEFIGWFRQHTGWRRLAPAVQEVLFG